MKRFLSLIILFISIKFSFGQLPVIYNPHISPSNPTENDTVIFIYEYAFGSSPCVLDSINIEHITYNEFLAESYYSMGMLTMPCYDIDSIQLGVLQCDDYSLNFFILNNLTFVDTAIVDFHVDCSEGILYKSNNNKSLSIYPNPTSSTITIQAPNIQNIKLYNIEGRTIYDGKDNEVDLGGEAKGIYIIKVTTSKFIVVEKIILE